MLGMCGLDNLMLGVGMMLRTCGLDDPMLGSRNDVDFYHYRVTSTLFLYYMVAKTLIFLLWCNRDPAF